MKLVGFVLKICNKPATLLLKNGTQLNGTIIGADEVMNTHLTDVQLTSKSGNTINLKMVTGRGNHVLHYILPDNIPLQTLLRDDDKMKINAAKEVKADIGNGRGRGRGRKGSKKHGKNKRR